MAQNGENILLQTGYEHFHLCSYVVCVLHQLVNFSLQAFSSTLGTSLSLEQDTLFVSCDICMIYGVMHTRARTHTHTHTHTQWAALTRH